MRTRILFCEISKKNPYSHTGDDDFSRFECFENFVNSCSQIPKKGMRSDNSVIYEMNVRQLTAEGTLAAAARKLEFIRSLGVDILWLMPVYPIGEQGRKGSLGSYYAIRDYLAINPEFGTMADFDAFVERAHGLGLKVILDWVVNQTSRDAVWLTQKPALFYEREADGTPKVAYDWDDTAKLNFANPEVWDALVEGMKFWMTEHNVDGFRCDMAMLCPVEFWRKARRELSALKSDVYMLAEAEGTQFFDRAFDACYGWELYHILNDIAQSRTRVPALRDCIHRYIADYPIFSRHMLFTSNHDENSWCGTEFERLGASVCTMAALTFLLPESLPLIYTGQEFGYNHKFEFFEKDPMPSVPENNYTRFYRKMSEIRHSNKALWNWEKPAQFIEINTNAMDCIMVFVREHDGNRVVCIMNVSPYEITCDYHTGIYAGRYRNAMTGAEYVLPEHVQGMLHAWEFHILCADL